MHWSELYQNVFVGVAMYSYEIDEKLRNNNYVLNADDYINICMNSPQISKVTYMSFGNTYEIQTYDGWNWIFTLKELKE